MKWIASQIPRSRVSSSIDCSCSKLPGSLRSIIFDSKSWAFEWERKKYILTILSIFIFSIVIKKKIMKITSKCWFFLQKWLSTYMFICTSKCTLIFMQSKIVLKWTQIFWTLKSPTLRCRTLNFPNFEPSKPKPKHSNPNMFRNFWRIFIS